MKKKNDYYYPISEEFFYSIKIIQTLSSTEIEDLVDGLGENISDEMKAAAFVVPHNRGLGAAVFN
jgi:hypothetical protein